MKSAFVIMPFSGTQAASEVEWEDTYTNVFAPTFEEVGYSCDRAKPETGSLIKSIIAELQSAWVVLADVTDQNPNVFYELGVRHTLSKRTIIVARDTKAIPSDLKGYWTIVYDTSPGGVVKFKKTIKSIIQNMEENPEKSDSPVSDFLKYEVSGVKNVISREISNQLSALITELSGIENTLREAQISSKFRSFLYFQCINNLLDTHYVDLGPDLFSKFYEFRHRLKIILLGDQIDRDYIAQTLSMVSKMNSDLTVFFTQYTQGNYIEPSNVTTMDWEHCREDEENENHYSKAVQIAPSALSELKSKIKK